MKVTILVPFFPPKWLAGTEIATYNIARHLAKRGHEVHVVTSIDKGLPKKSKEQGFHVHRIGWRKVRFLGIISFWLEILLVLSKIEPDIVHSQDINMGMPGLIAKRLLKKPFLVWGRGSDVYLPGSYMRPLSKLVLRNADAVIALTQDMKTQIQKIYSREILVIPNGIDIKSFEKSSREKARAKLRIKKKERIVTFVGTLRPIKGLEYLVQALNIMGKKGPRVKLMLVGDGEEKEHLEGLVGELELEEDVMFIGRVPNEEIPEYMAASDVFVLPSLSEGFPNVVLQAMAAGLPIIASKVGGLPEIIEEGGNGFLVEPKNAAQIADRISQLLEDDELRLKISRNNRRKATQYSWEAVVDRLEEVYQSFLQTYEPPLV